MKIDIYENNFALGLLWNSYRAWIELEISVYSLSDFGVASNLIGSLSRSNWALFTPYGENTKKVTKSVVEITEWVLLKQLFFSISGNSGRI